MVLEIEAANIRDLERQLQARGIDPFACVFEPLGRGPACHGGRFRVTQIEVVDLDEAE